ncbi:MAG: hypothetical protein ABGY41_14255 [Candidatus Poribacteria bacterium]
MDAAPAGGAPRSDVDENQPNLDGFYSSSTFDEQLGMSVTGHLWAADEGGGALTLPA